MRSAAAWGTSWRVARDAVEELAKIARLRARYPLPFHAARRRTYEALRRRLCLAIPSPSSGADVAVAGSVRAPRSPEHPRRGVGVVATDS